MTNTLTKIVLAAAATFLLTSTALAAPMTLSVKQMDAVAAGGVEKVDGFVCPVISTGAVLNSAKGITINGAYSILGPNVSVPILATNQNGAGVPGGTHASPGDANYTAVWGFRP